jgi:flagellar biosynthesis/type III secretory pathway protein FliH
MTSSSEVAGLALPRLLGESSAPRRPDGDWAPPELAGASSAMASGVEGIEEAARARGYDEGLRAGEARALERLKPAWQALAGVADSLEEAAARFLRDRQCDLTSLALAVARQLVQREVTADPDIVSGLVARALDLLPADTSLEVRLHPDDLAALGERLEQVAPASRSVSLRGVSDPALERGDFVIESPQRVIDGRTDTALRSLYDRLTGG